MRPRKNKNELTSMIALAIGFPAGAMAIATPIVLWMKVQDVGAWKCLPALALYLIGWAAIIRAALSRMPRPAYSLASGVFIAFSVVLAMRLAAPPEPIGNVIETARIAPRPHTVATLRA